MKTIYREIHPQIKVLDAGKGLVEYVASNETLDIHNEIIRAAGWRFNRFQKNAPFVDSHNYNSIGCVLGKVTDFKVSGKNLVETVQWAIDVGENLLAQWGFDMTKAGYLKAVSVGFMPVRMAARWDSDKSDYNAQCAELGIPRDVAPDVIYVEQEQLELSACVIGANPDAIARSYRAGILNDTLAKKLAKQFPEFGCTLQRAVSPERRTAFSFPRVKSSNAIDEMFAAFGRTPPSSTTTEPHTMKTEKYAQYSAGTKSAFEKIELARRSGSQSELERTLKKALSALASEKRANCGDPVARYFEENPERRLFWNGIGRRLAGKLKSDSAEYRALADVFGGATQFEDIEKSVIATRAASGFNLQDAFGSALLLAIPVFDEMWDLLLQYGAYKFLGLRKMIGQYTQYAQVTGFPNAVFISPNQQGTVTIPADTSLAGKAAVPEANTIAALVTVSRAWLDDEKVDLSEVLFSKFVQGLASRIDFGCFQGNGNDDANNGMTKGIFFDPSIATVNSHAGAGSVTALQRSDLINVLGNVNAAAFQRMDTQPPRWYISPLFIPLLLPLVDGTAPNYLLKTPAETGGEWLLIGFPVTWATAAPSVNQVGSKALAFGNPDSYLVALHEKFEIGIEEGGAGFPGVNVNYRPIARGKSQLREATGFATLTLQ